MTERNKEKLRPENALRFQIYRPGGNDTCLIEGIVADPLRRRQINDTVMKLYPNVEQVGFINPDTNFPELMMAGDEFCGNATRSTAWRLLDGGPGDVAISVSGVDSPLRAGVDSERNAFSQMPIYPNMEFVSETGNGLDAVVKMEGITHYVTWQTEDLESKTDDQIKTDAYKKMQELGIDQDPAAGVIYVKNTNEGYVITPVVYVRDINTLFLETACGSGTTALGLILAKQSQTELTDVSVMQPTGLPIRIRIGSDGTSFLGAEISGPIEEICTGEIYENGQRPVAIERIKKPSALSGTVLENLKRLYQGIFSQAPYFEDFSDQEVEKIFSDYVANGLLFLARSTEGVIGFGAAMPLDSVPDVQETVGAYDLDLNNAWYMADLGVREDFRFFGIGRQLVQARLNALPNGNPVVMRTSVNNIASQTLYRGLGFTPLAGITQDVTKERVGGSVENDQRIFLAKLV